MTTPEVKLEPVNGIPAETVLRYLEYLLCARYQGSQDLAKPLYGMDYYKGAEGSVDPVMGAHYELNNAAACMVGNIAKQLGFDVYEYSRGNPNKPDTRTFLSHFEDQGVKFK